MKDPKGNTLHRVLLQVMDADDEGPISLRVRRDHEKIDLTNDRTRTFMIVWAPVDRTLGEKRLNDMYEDLEAMRDLQVGREAERVELERGIRAFERDLAALRDENKAKTEALRALQKERDPDRLSALATEQAAAATAKLTEELRAARTESATLRSEVTELRAAKKRLKEANERLKGAR